MKQGPSFLSKKDKTAKCGLVLFNCKSKEYGFNISNFVRLKTSSGNNKQYNKEIL